MRKITIVALIVACLWGCVDNALKFSIRFDQVNGLKKADRIVFNNNHIGSVIKVFYTEKGDYLVDVAIAYNFKNAATKNSRFFIIDDPQKPSNKAIDIVTPRSGGEIILAGSTVEGSGPEPSLLDLSKGLETGLKMLNEKIYEMTKKYEQFLDEAKKIPDSEAYRNIEEELQRLMEQMKDSSESVKEQLENEIIPKFQKEMERLKKKLEMPPEPQNTTAQPSST